MGMEKGARRKPVKPAATRKPTSSTAQQVRFRCIAPAANTVTLAGDFNDWDIQANPLRKDEQGVWKTTLRLQPGIYQYKFVIDGAEWTEDPQNPNRVPSPHGTFNSVCEVV